MNERDTLLLTELKQRVTSRFPELLMNLILFGSRARGDQETDSDLDLVALVSEKTPALEKTIDDLAYQVMWDYDFKPIISLRVFSQSDFNKAVKKGFSFYKNVEREGIPL